MRNNFQKDVTSYLRLLFFFFTALYDWLRKLLSTLSANQMQNWVWLKLYFEFLAHFLLVMLTFGVISSQWWFLLFWLSDPWSQSFSLKKKMPFGLKKLKVDFFILYHRFSFFKFWITLVRYYHSKKLHIPTVLWW